jgi:hypothetical protein
MINEALRTAISLDLAPVRRLPPPFSRVLSVVPLALLLLLAAPVVFEFRELRSLGWMWSWGASALQTTAGLIIIALALRESVPGRNLRSLALAGVVVGVVLLFIAVTAGAWSANPVSLSRDWWQIGAMCAIGSATSALPAVVLCALLIVRAYPLRPAVAGAVAGLGGGLLADAGWRLFCHFSEPAHVLAAHFGGVAVATLAGALLTPWLDARAGRQIPG